MSSTLTEDPQLLDQQLRNAFLNAVAYFNDARWTDLAGLLDDNAAVTKIKNSGVPYTIWGKSGVMRYLQGENNPPSNTAKMLVDASKMDVNIHTGTVSGPAQWDDQDTPSHPIPADDIQYSFIFIKHVDSPPPNWFLVNLYATGPKMA